MENIVGFLLINIYAFLLIISTTIIFFSKQRLREFEDETYKYFLITNIFMSLSGLVLGLVVSPEFNFNDLVIVLLNKLYLVCLLVWITILTFYYLYITLKDKINIKAVINFVSTKIPVFLYVKYKPNPSIIAKTIESIFVYPFIFALPSSPPSLANLSSEGIIIASN